MNNIHELELFIRQWMPAQSKKIQLETVSILDTKLCELSIVKIYRDAIRNGITATKLYNDREVYGFKIRKQAHFPLYKWIETYSDEGRFIHTFVHGLSGKNWVTYKSISVRDVNSTSGVCDGLFEEINDFIAGLDWESWFDLSLDESLTCSSSEYDIDQSVGRRFELEIATLTPFDGSDGRQYYLYYESGQLHVEHMFSDFPVHNLVSKLMAAGVWE